MAGEPSTSSSAAADAAYKRNDTERQPLLQHKPTSPTSSEHGHYNTLNTQSTSRSPSVPAQSETSLAIPVWRFRLYIGLIVLFGITFICSLLLLLLVPRFAQKTFDNGVQLDFTKADIQSTETKDGQTVISMHVIGAITLLPSAYSLSQTISNVAGDIQLAPTSVYLVSTGTNTRMGNIYLPSMTLASDTNVTCFDFVTPFTVDDPSALVDFAQQALTLKLVTWRVSGIVPINVGWLPLQQTMQLDKQVTMEGMNGLKRTELKDIVFPGSHPVGGISLEGTVGIYNPSKTLSMSIGDVNFGIYLFDDGRDDGSRGGGDNDSHDELIAVVKSKDTQLYGERMNYFSLTGRTLSLDPQETHKQQLMEDFLTRYLHGNTSLVRVRGSSFGPGDTAASIKTMRKLPDWLQQALEATTLTVPFPGTTHQDVIRSLTMENIKIDFSMVSRAPLVSGDAIAMLKLPAEMQFSLNVTSIQPDVYVYLDQDAQEPFGQLKPDHPCTAYTIHPGDNDDNGDIPYDMFKVISKVNKVPFKVLPGHEAEFEKFLDRVFHRQNTTVYLQGSANATVESELGKLTVRDLRFKGKIDSVGMQGINHPPPRVESLTINKGYPDALQVMTRLVINNPSDMDIVMGPVIFTMTHNGSDIGNVTVDLNLVHGTENVFDATGYIFAEPVTRQLTCTCSDKEAPKPSVIEFISDYISGRATHLVISGRNGSTASKFLAPLVKRLAFKIQIPNFDGQPLLQDIQMNLLSSTAIIWLRNPFEHIDMQIIQINASTTYEREPIGTLFARFTDPALTLAPVSCQIDGHCLGSVVQTPKLPVRMRKFDLDTVSKALGGKLPVDVSSVVTVKIDQFLLKNLDYQRTNITAIIKKSF